MSRRVILSHSKKVLIVVICITLVILVRNILSSILSTHERSQILERLQSELASKKEQETILQQRLALAKTDAFVEQEARIKLGLVREGEKIIADERVKPVQPKIVEPEPPNWQKWLSIFQ